ncbi:bifunctional nicotinamidase/pyrazinamidase [Rhodanobacter glycinis]|uniref:nicotinamidase n=1 Tax=Rhodanobacter glycinis TaxID=582702 RepID=A0A5B9E6D4_9GAMM|nr:bifunctional nicotinamidase/pyrazinamidase [Rhodanobacter glycinis]QEE25827.1 bifunctional nicotinamidase/pyrazinamidase [Rhodanobacter glycinis]
MPHTIHEHAALIVVDVQPDFMPGGTLACHEGDAIVPGIDQLLRRRLFRHVVATQDWHPRGHASFASVHAGTAPFQQIELHGHPQTLWPDHCVQGTPGAALHPAIDWTAADLILRKGSDPQVDSYSAFRENHDPQGTRPVTGLAGWLRERGVDEVYVCGLARDVCVLWTAQDAVASGFRAQLLWDFTRPVAPGGDEALRASLSEAGIGIVDAASLQPAQALGPPQP